MLVSPEQLKGPHYQTVDGVWVVDNRYEFDRFKEQLYQQQIVGIDTETVGCNPRKESPIGKARIVVWSCSWIDESLGKHPICGVPLANRVFIKNYDEAESEGWLQELGEWFSREDYRKVGHNLFSYDRHVFRNHGIVLNGIETDTLRASRLENVARMEHGLKFWGSGEHFQYDMPGEYGELFKRPKIGKRGGELKTFELIPMTEAVRIPELLATLYDYATMDSKVTLELHYLIRDMLKKWRWLGNELTMSDYYDELLNPYMYLLNSIEHEGQPIDIEWCSMMSKKADEAIAKYGWELTDWANVDMNFASPKQLAHLLYGEGEKVVVKGGKAITGKGFPIPVIAKNKKSDVPTDDVALEWLEHHVRGKKNKAGVAALRSYREAEGLKGKYLDKLPRFCDRHGRIHAQIAPDTETVRLAARNPPVQQIPRADGDLYGIREAFTAPEGYVYICGDYGQLEMRILAHFLIELFDDHKLAEDLQHSDLHSATAKRIYAGLGVQEMIDCPVEDVKKRFPEYRNKGKTLNFAVNYGKGAYGLGRDLLDDEGNPIGQEAAQVILDAYLSAYPAVPKFQRWAKQYGEKHGYVRSILGNYRPVPELRSMDKWIRAHGERKAGNTPIQMSAANIAMLAQLKCNTYDVPALVNQGYYHRELADLGAVQVMQVHDEIQFLCPAGNHIQAMALIKHGMENALDKPLHVPLPVDIDWGSSWGSAK